MTREGRNLGKGRKGLADAVKYTWRNPCPRDEERRVSGDALRSVRDAGSGREAWGKVPVREAGSRYLHESFATS